MPGPTRVSSSFCSCVIMTVLLSTNRTLCPEMLDRSGGCHVSTVFQTGNESIDGTHSSCTRLR